MYDYPGNTGDGFVMALRAGAGVTGMEYTQRTMLIKDTNMPLLAICVSRGGRVLDCEGNILMEGEVANTNVMNEAFTRGRGPVHIQLSHLPEERIREIEHILFTTERPVNERFFAGRHIDFRKQDIELWPTEYYLCGGHGLAGIRVNERAETAVPGLYAAGDVASVAKQHLTGAFVFGEVAAEQAVKYVAEAPDTAINETTWPPSRPNSTNVSRPETATSTFTIWNARCAAWWPTIWCRPRTPTNLNSEVLVEDVP